MSVNRRAKDGVKISLRLSYRYPALFPTDTDFENNIALVSSLVKGA